MFLQRSLGKSPTRAERKIIPAFLFFLLATWLNLAENLQLLIATGKHFHLSLLRSCTNCHRKAENNTNIFWLCTDLYHMNSLVHRKHHDISIWGEDIHLSGERCLMSKVILFSGFWKTLQKPPSAQTPFNPLTFLERQKRDHLFRTLHLVNELCDYNSGEYKALKSLLQIKHWSRQIPGAFQRRFLCSLEAAHQSQAPILTRQWFNMT